jgi:hypothetical protein
MDFDTLADFYVKGYEVVRASETILDGNEVMVVIHDAFQVSPGSDHEELLSRPVCHAVEFACCTLAWESSR